VLGDVVGGGADELHPAVVRLLVRPRALEARQERVMDIDRALLNMRANPRRQNLHVAREYDQVAALLLDELEQPFFLFGFVSARDRQVMKRNALGDDQRLEIAMVRYDGRNFD